MKKPGRSRPVRRDPADELNRAILACESGRLAEAEKACRKALAAHPEWPQARHVMGVINFRQGATDLAIANLRQAIRHDPDYGPAYNDLGNVLQETGKLEESISVFSRLNELVPDQPTTLNNLGVTYRDHRQYELAVAVLRKATSLHENYLSAWLNLGYALLCQRDFPEAVKAFERAALIEPGKSEPLRVLAHVYRQIGENEKSLGAYRRWQEVEPACEIPSFMIAALAATGNPLRATDAFIREEFDRFADSFDKKLELLKYQAPQLVVQQLAKLLGSPTSSLDVLDAGCGTGKGGVLIRSYARKLTGVDISSGMLAHARRRGVYDELFEKELVEYLKETSGSWDLITVIDTLIYFGELAEPLSASANALKSGGYLIFTVEAASDESTRYRLAPTGRFVHGRAYLEESAGRAGFGEYQISEVELREEGGQPVQGYLFWARK